MRSYDALRFQVTYSSQASGCGHTHVLSQVAKATAIVHLQQLQQSAVDLIDLYRVRGFHETNDKPISVIVSRVSWRFATISLILESTEELMSASTNPGSSVLRRVFLMALLLVSTGGAHPRSTFAPPSHAARDSRVANIIRQSGAALHVAVLRSIAIVHAKGIIVANGLSGTCDDWNEIGGMRETSRFSTPPLGGGTGWDGKESWTLDQTGLVIIDGSVLGRSIAIDQAYFSNYDLWKPGRGGASVAWGGSTSQKGRSYDVLTVTPSKSAYRSTSGSIMQPICRSRWCSGQGRW